MPPQTPRRRYPSVPVRGRIRLGQFLKLANLVEDGAQAREVIQHGLVKVNGDIEEARGKQLHPGDTVTLNGVTVKVAHEG